MPQRTTKSIWIVALTALLLSGTGGVAVAQPASDASVAKSAPSDTVTRAGSAALGDAQPAAIKARSTKKGAVVTRLGKKGRSTGEYLEAGAMTTDARGRVLVAGTDNNFLVVLRYNAKGRLDKKFGTKGVTRVKLGKNGAAAADVVVDGKGRVVVAATANAYSGKSQARVVRLTAKGKLDKKFASKGIFTQKRAASSAVLVDARNRVVLVGRSLKPSGAWITRLTAKGKVDAGFGTKGATRFSKYGAQENEFVGTGTTGALFDSHGRIVVHVNVNRGIGQPSEFGLARLLADGTLDETFHGEGWSTRTHKMPEGSSLTVTASGIASLGENGFFSAGGADGSFALFRYSPDGAPWGIVDVNSVSKYLDERAVAVTTDASGRVLSAGTATQQAGITRHTIADELDKSFAKKGAELRKVPGFRELRVMDLTVDAKGRVLVLASGYPKKHSKRDAIVILRYTAAGKPDVAWGR